MQENNSSEMQEEGGEIIIMCSVKNEMKFTCTL